MADDVMGRRGIHTSLCNHAVLAGLPCLSFMPPVFFRLLFFPPFFPPFFLPPLHIP